MIKIILDVISKKIIARVSALLLVLMCVSGVYAEEAGGGKTLIMYYSLTGNTRAGCEALQKELDADIMEIKDLRNRSGKWGFFCAAMGSLFRRHTSINPVYPDLSGYDNIIIGTPIWTGTFSTAIRTLIKKNSFAGKKVIIYTTTNAAEKEKYKEKGRNLIRKKGGEVLGYYQVLARVEIDGEKVERTKEQMVADTLTFVPDIKNGFGL